MSETVVRQIRKQIEAHQVALQGLEKELSSAARTDEHSEALRDMRQAVIALARCQRGLGAPAFLQLPAPSQLNPAVGL